MIFRFQMRRGTAAEAAASNPVLRDGEEGWEKDTRRRKVGDGETNWNDLPYEDEAVVKANFKQIARTPELIIVGAITRDGNGAATGAAVVWPDGKPGTYTATTVSSAFPGAVDAYTITYGSPVTATYTQAAVTRDSSTGAVTAVPAITVS